MGHEPSQYKELKRKDKLELLQKFVMPVNLDARLYMEYAGMTASDFDVSFWANWENVSTIHKGQTVLQPPRAVCFFLDF